ncbi:hypothetical protein [Methanobrevibacter sp.]|uniref:hypothetical protein n=1 Tax=Methanobrevibacter sp. TaxID=66852 RepID=UPI0025E307D1|nr:hypothetical protein [Methanobrevibacter sp.]MBR4448532.1 hypothetical protein [Methanobrevibacter sp.]
MNTCPNCLKKLNENFAYCYECGSEIDGEIIGDFKTNLLNVFQVNNGYIYIFSVHGRQIVLKADSLEELEELVRIHKFPWMELENKHLSFEASKINAST